MFCSPGHVFGGTEGVTSQFHLFHSWAHFLVVPRASVPVFMFCVPGLVLGGTEGVRSHFHVLRSRTHFRQYRGQCVPFSSFAHPDSFSAVPTTSGPVFMFCAPGLVFGGSEIVGSCFYILRSRTRFRQYRGRLDTKVIEEKWNAWYEAIQKQNDLVIRLLTHLLNHHLI
jgi:hypothetical protein